MSGGALFFAAHLREACAQQFFLPFLLDDEILERCEVNKPDAGDTLSGDGAVTRQARDVVEREVDCACGIARPDVGYAVEDHLA